MIDISTKSHSYRSAVAVGKLLLKHETLECIHKKGIKKGDPFVVAQIAGIQAVKQTSNLIPFCHPIQITTVEIQFSVEQSHINASCSVKTIERTGVEMEALVGVTNALNTIWDMVKYLEKDSEGQYPTTKITDIQVISKTKEQVLVGYNSSK